MVSARLVAVAAARVSGQAAATLTQAMTRTNDTGTLVMLAQSVSEVAARLDGKAAGETAATLTQTLTATSDLAAIQSLAQGLSAVATRLEGTEAGEVAAALAQAMSKTNNVYAVRSLAEALAAVSARMEPNEAAVTLTQAMTKTDDVKTLQPLARGLSEVLGDAKQDARARAVTATVGLLHNNQGLPGAALQLRPAVEPFPRRLSDQELVELLKHPLCVGPARRAVLDQLGNYHGRTFADVWEFVRFAQEQKLDLDFTGPPKRPEPLAGR